MTETLDNVPAMQQSQWTKDQIELIKRTVAVGATNDELALFLYQAHRTGLDPLARQIHFSKRGGRAVIITGIDGYRLVAERSGKYAGNDAPIYEGEEAYEGGIAPAKATVTVWKLIAGQRVPFTAVAFWREYYPGDTPQGFMWRRMPHLMLGKVAEALALRKAFPAELSGVYTLDEVDASPAPAQEAEPTPPPSKRVLTDYQQRFFDRVKARLGDDYTPMAMRRAITKARDRWREKHNESRDILDLSEDELDEVYELIEA